MNKDLFRKPAPVSVCQLLLNMMHYADTHRLPYPVIRLPRPFARIITEAIESEYPGFNAAHVQCGEDVVAMLGGVNIVDFGDEYRPGNPPRSRGEPEADMRDINPFPESDDQAPAAPTFAEAVKLVENARYNSADDPNDLVRALLALNVINLRPDDPVEEQPIPPVPDIDTVIRNTFNGHTPTGVEFVAADRSYRRLRINYRIDGMLYDIEHGERTCGRGASLRTIIEATIDLAAKACTVANDVRAKQPGQPITGDTGVEHAASIPAEIGRVMTPAAIDIVLMTMNKTGWRFTRAPVMPATPYTIPQRLLDCLAPDTAKHLASVLLETNHVVEPYSASAHDNLAYRLPRELERYFAAPEVITRILRQENLVIVPEKRDAVPVNR